MRLRIANGRVALEERYLELTGDRDVAAFSQRFGCQVVDGFGSTEGGVNIARTPRTPSRFCTAVARTSPAKGAIAPFPEFRLLRNWIL